MGCRHVPVLLCQLGQLLEVAVEGVELRPGQRLDIDQPVARPFSRGDQLVELELDGLAVLFWVCWIRNTIRKVTMIVAVLMTSCQVSPNPNKGPVVAQTMMTTMATRKAQGLPVA